jgi:uncharacterized coiled-coil protein SlyX
MEDLAERVLELEVRIAYQDRTITALDAVVRDLGAQVAALTAEIVKLRERNEAAN